jgi:hypothetical protein
MSQRPRAWVSLTLGSDTPSNAGREAAPTLLSCLTIHVVQHHAGLGGPEYERGGLCIKQYDAEGLLVNTETIQLCSRRKEAKTTKKGSKDRGKDVTIYRNSGLERACMMTKKSAFVISFLLVTTLF